MSELPAIKTAGGYVLDVTQLEPGDAIVIKGNEWPHNFVGLDFKQLSQYFSPFPQDIYIATVVHKPINGITVNIQDESDVHVFRGAKEDK